MATATRKTNWFAIWTSIAVVVVLIVIAGIVVVSNLAASGPGTTPTASNVDQETGAISFGEGEDTLDTYIDFQCPVCKSFEESYGAAIQALVDDGSVTLNIHPISILDSRSSGTEYSTRSASAMYCVAENDPSVAMTFMQSLFTSQPAEGASGLTDEEITSIAQSSGATNSDSCIADGTYKQFVTSLTPKTPIAPGSTRIGTPTIAVNGEAIDNSTLPNPDSLASLFG